jgi:signal recognition particle subunit SRP72
LQDSPEHADLSTNLSAVNAQLDFISSVPSLLGDIQSSSKPLPSIEHLENTPVAPLVSSHRAYRARVTNAVAPTAEPSASTSASTSAPSTAAKGKRAKKQPKKDAPAKTKKVKLPPSIAALPEDKRPAPDPERWLPKRERSGFAEQMAQKQKEKEKQRLKARKKMEAALTQGAAADEGATSSAAQGQAAGRGQQQQQQQGKGQQQQQQQKKKKGKK